MTKKPKHDHRSSLHVLSINGAHIYWCYRCGAIRYDGKWHRTTGMDGENPAVIEYLRKHKTT